MLRIAVALSALVVIAWVVLAAAALQSHDDLAGVAVIFLALYAVLALVTIWLIFSFARILAASRRAARELRTNLRP